MDSQQKTSSLPTVLDPGMSSRYPHEIRTPAELHKGTTISDGYSLRKLNNEIIALRKENFNLKLSIHDYEERLTKVLSHNHHYNNLAEKYKRAKRQIEELHKNNDQKCKLLIEGADALTHHENMYNRHMQEAEGKVVKLEAYVDLLEDKVKELSDESIKAYINKLEKQLSKQSDEILKTKNQIVSLRRDVRERDKSIEVYKSKIEEISDERSEYFEVSDEQQSGNGIVTELLELRRQELETCKKESSHLKRTLDSLLPQIKSQKEMLMDAEIAIKIMQGREKVMREALDSYERKVMISNRKLQLYVEQNVQKHERRETSSMSPSEAQEHKYTCTSLESRSSSEDEFKDFDSDVEVNFDSEFCHSFSSDSTTP